MKHVPVWIMVSQTGMLDRSDSISFVNRLHDIELGAPIHKGDMCRVLAIRMLCVSLVQIGKRTLYMYCTPDRFGCIKS